jgi:hypothetical protein
MANLWTLKMEQYTRFSKEERETLDRLVSERPLQHAAGEDIIREGDHSPDCDLILSGLPAATRFFRTASARLCKPAGDLV